MRRLLMILLALLPVTAAAKVEVVTTLPHLAYIAREIGGDKVDASALATGRLDPHYITPTPALMTRVRNARLFVEIGLQLELWTERVIDGSNNLRIRPGASGHLYASSGVLPLEIPALLSRSEGDLHPSGNPHIWLDPLRARRIAANIAAGLQRVDPDNAKHYAVRLKAFEQRLDQALFGKELVALFGGDLLRSMAEQGKLTGFLERKKLGGKPLADRLGGWLKKARPLRGKPVVYYHKSWIYFTSRFGLQIAGYIEEKPGIPPSARHRADLVRQMQRAGIKLVVVESFNSEKTAQQVVEGSGAAVVAIPIDVGGSESATDYFKLIDAILDGHLKAFGH